jgi:hypothetical protein
MITQQQTADYINANINDVLTADEIDSLRKDHTSTGRDIDQTVGRCQSTDRDKGR